MLTKMSIPCRAQVALLALSKLAGATSGVYGHHHEFRANVQKCRANSTSYGHDDIPIGASAINRDARVPSSSGRQPPRVHGVAYNTQHAHHGNAIAQSSTIRRPYPAYTPTVIASSAPPVAPVSNIKDNSCFLRRWHNSMQKNTEEQQIRTIALGCTAIVAGGLGAHYGPMSEMYQCFDEMNAPGEFPGGSNFDGKADMTFWVIFGCAVASFSSYFIIHTMLLGAEEQYGESCFIVIHALALLMALGPILMTTGLMTLNGFNDAYVGGYLPDEATADGVDFGDFIDHGAGILVLIGLILFIAIPICALIGRLCEK